MMRKEVKTSDIIFFNSKTGTGSVVEVPGKDKYFMPAKKMLRLPGEKSPIVNGESFVFLGYEVLKAKKNHRIIKVQLSRLHDRSIFFIEEHFLRQYFGIAR